ncbi:ABC-type sugar transport system, permease component [Halapricum desulfuricans]|uniref:ABC-type sugar transport system, permease component n=1 Tax=Halapricum desulfuricans TaxID=2841257 RepID=A0A897NKL3_9EURY|nr:carbohydrate ABC transporter permease [Halapricum desulfuricans]QSG13198.1 ABC-type sugar transport system, permease component [Halapricum desulfuricans]
MSDVTTTGEENRFVDRLQAYLQNVSWYRVGIYVVMYGLAALYFIPYWRMFQISVTPTDFIAAGQFHWIPPDMTFEFWTRYLFEELVIYRWAFNTLIISSLTTIIVLVADSMIAFSLTRLDWPGQGVILGLIVSSFMVPVYVNIIPLYSLIDDLGLINSYWGVLLPLAAQPLGVFLLYQFFKDLPEGLEEAARLDGFSTFRIYWKLTLPLSMPILTALGLFQFIWAWNQFLWPLIVLNQDQLYTLPIGVITLRDQHAIWPNLIMTSTALVSIPLFIVFLLFQDKLISSIQMQAGVG